MKKAMMWMVALTLLVGAALHAQDAGKDLSGNWQGTLQMGQGIRTVFKISKADGSGWKAVLYNVDQNPQPIPIASITLQGSTVSFAIKPLDATFQGTLNPDGNSITGNATQGGQPHALNLQRVTEENTWAIPEPPKPMPLDAKPGFDVATIKPSTPGQPGKRIGFRGRHFTAVNFDVNDLIALGYGLHVKQIVGAPDWFGTELFDIDGVPDVEGQPNQKQMDIMMQKLLADRFKLVFHHEKRELAVYAITLGKGGPKMDKSATGPNDPVGFGFRKLGSLTVRNLTMADFATWMQASVMDKPVVDQTGLTDRYDFTLNWTPDDTQFAQFRSTGATIPTTEDPNAPPGLYTAVQEQLGLKMEPVKAPDDVIVIDHVEKPSAN